MSGVSRACVGVGTCLLALLPAIGNAQVRAAIPYAQDSSAAGRAAIVEALIRFRREYLPDPFPVDRTSLQAILSVAGARQRLEVRLASFLAPVRKERQTMPWREFKLVSFRLGESADSADVVITASVAQGEYSHREAYYLTCRPGADRLDRSSWYVRDVRLDAFIQTLYRGPGG